VKGMTSLPAVALFTMKLKIKNLGKEKIWDISWEYVLNIARI
jgi:hypothetical protein